MLTLDILPTRIRGNKIEPRYIPLDDLNLLAMAGNIIAIFQEHLGKKREELENVLNDLLGEGKQMLLFKGFCKLLEDRCVFSVHSSTDPAQVRETIFKISSDAHQEGAFDRKRVLETASLKLGISPPVLEDALYADLKQYHVLKELSPISAQNLARHYNTALAQGLLLKATRMTINIRETEPLRYRQLFRAIKFYRLLYRIEGNPESGFTIHLDGPMSLFQSCQKYGLQMAIFLPALILCDSWEMEAELKWGRSQRPLFFSLTSRQGLHSHYPDTGMYFPPEFSAFKDRFAGMESEWEIHDDCFFLEIAPQQIAIPDYAFIHTPTGKTVYLEIFGFWRKALLEKRMAMLAHCPHPLIHAVPQKWSVDQKEGFLEHERLYFFHEVLNPKEILKRLGQCLDA